jgi:hypothetical protein
VTPFFAATDLACERHRSLTRFDVADNALQREEGAENRVSIVT